MPKSEVVTVQGTEVAILRHRSDDYISLTDMAKFKNPQATGVVISHWLSTRYTVEFMGVWERVHNPGFNVTEFSNIRNESGGHGYVLTSKQWIEMTNAIGLIAVWRHVRTQG
ncbi:MAG: KilA-N domain-containing protein, partial [Holophagaceae bacterium]|nr:KilA-N domain-containing protein [Holophagaceae bacterium]